ncbi:MAG: PAS domain S-box protein [Gemmatimonadaceae bacterium]
MPLPLPQSRSLDSAWSLSDSAYRVMVNAMSHGVMLCDREGRVRAANPAAARLLRLTNDVLVGTTVADACAHAVREDGTPLDPAEHPMSITLRTGVPLDDVVVGLPRPGARTTWTSVSTRVLPDAQGTGMDGVVVTIAECTQCREEVAALQLQSLVARRTDDAVVITDGAGRTEWVNTAFTTLNGYALEEIVGRTPGELLHGPETDPEVPGEIAAALSRGEGWHGEVLNYRKDGSAFWVEQNITPSIDATGHITHFVSVARDISSRRNEARRMFQLSAAMAASVDGIALVDSFQEFRFANDAFARLVGFESGDALVGKSWRVLYDADALRRYDHEVVPSLFRHDRWRGETVARRRDGTLFPQELSLSLLNGGSMVVVARDITDRKAAEAEQARLTAILEATPDLIAISSVSGDVPYLNVAGRAMVGCGAEERLTVEALYPEWALTIVQHEGIPFAVAHGAWSGETALKTRDGREIPVSQVLIAHKNGRGEVEHLSTIMRDITERKEAEESLKQLSICDQLTGLYNRRGFFMLAQQHLNVARTLPGHSILFYLDINDLKPINDTFGHHAGDDAIRDAADILRETFRDSDIVGRLGGDEFVALAVNCLDASGEVLLQRLEQNVVAYNARGARQYALTLSRGMARFDPSRPRNLQQLLEEADARLYEHKRSVKVARAQVSDV